MFGYVFPLLAKFENTVRNTIVNAVKIVVARLWQTAAFAGTGTVAFINSRLLVQIFDEFIPEKMAQKEIL